jgi:hypothetical protein
MHALARPKVVTDIIARSLHIFLFRILGRKVTELQSHHMFHKVDHDTNTCIAFQETAMKYLQKTVPHIKKCTLVMGAASHYKSYSYISDSCN